MDSSSEQEKFAAAGEQADAEVDYERRHEQSVALNLLVLQRRVGQALDTNVYYGNRVIAERGQPITEGMIARLRRLKARHLKFSNDEPRLLELD